MLTRAEDVDDIVEDLHVDTFAGEAPRHRVEMLLHLDVVVHPGLGFTPRGIRPALLRQRAQCFCFAFNKQLPAACVAAPESFPVVDPVDLCCNSGVESVERGELLAR